MSNNPSYYDYCTLPMGANSGAWDGYPDYNEAAEPKEPEKPKLSACTCGIDVTYGFGKTPPERHSTYCDLYKAVNGTK